MDYMRWCVVLVCTFAGLAYLFIYDSIKRRKIRLQRYLSVGMCFGLAIAATWLANLQNLIGAPMLGLFCGMLLVNVIPGFSPEFKEGTTFAGKKCLNLGIILTGGTLSLSAVMSATRALPLILLNILFSFGIAFLIGQRCLKLSSNTCTLVGGGTAICGGSAIATLASIIKAKEDEIAYAMTAIFLFDIIGALCYPFLAKLLCLDSGQFGFLAGCAINDTSSVVASQATYMLQNPSLGDYNLAVTVKLVRTTMLILVAIVFTALSVRSQSANRASQKCRTPVLSTVRKVFPWFVLLFFAMAALNSLGVFERIPSFASVLKTGSKFFVTAALVGVGFKIKFLDLFTKGIKPILLGGCTWLTVAVSSLAFVLIFDGYINL